MRISYSKYSAFLQNPEKFRLYYCLGLTPEEDETPTRMNLGRRRGSCFHALAEARAAQFADRETRVASVYAMRRAELVTQYGEELVCRAERMLAVVPDIGPMFLVEESFEVPILDGKHSIMGRIDHGFTVDGYERLGDFKTTKGTRTKKEVNEYIAQMETSSQSHFYLKAAAAMGHPTDLFTYHVIFDAKDKASKPRYLPVDLHIGPAEVARTMAEVYAACEAIEYLTNEYGTEKPWPHSNHWPCCGDKFFCGYQGVCGRTIPRGATPPGFTQRYKELIQLD